MPKLKSVLLFSALILTLSLSAMAQTQPAATQSPTASMPDVQLLRAILEELRLQRAVLQRTYVNAYRAQTLTERLARQQARVDSLNEEITQLKSLIQQSQDSSREEEELKDLLAAINETTPQQREPLIQSYNSLKRALERQREYARQETERSRERQQQLETSLHAEQTKLAELQGQLEEMDRELEKLAGGKLKQ